ncbi:MAG: glucose-1-phosphate adenylyltransferase family protein [Nocardioidaceae bacterium]
MARDRILAIIQAGGAGGRMDVLTRERAKPSLPFAGIYRLIDFPLSNLTHSGISDVWLSVQFQGTTIQDEVVNGRPWDLDRNGGGLRLLHPQTGTGSSEEQGFAQGNADELFRIRDQIRSAEPELVIVMSADHVYRFDYTEAVRSHREADAECTVVTTEVGLEEAGDHATVRVDASGRVTDFEYKPDNPPTGTVATEIFVYTPSVLIEVLEELHAERGQDAEGDDTGLGDFGETLLPRLVDRGRTYAHPLPGYWRDLGQPHLYLTAHQDLLDDDSQIFGDPAWPFLSQQPQRMPARFASTARLDVSLVSPGARVDGIVERSVLGPGVVVEEGARVTNSVLYEDTVVRRGAQVHWTVVDSRCVIDTGATVGSPYADAMRDPDAVTLVGLESRIPADKQVAAGARLEPGTTA